MGGSGRLLFDAGDACHPPNLIDVIGRLTEAEARSLLFDILFDHPEAFEQALAALWRRSHRSPA